MSVIEYVQHKSIDDSGKTFVRCVQQGCGQRRRPVRGQALDQRRVGSQLLGAGAILDVAVDIRTGSPTSPWTATT